MEVKKELDVSIIPYEQCAVGTTFDLDQIIYDLDSQIELLSSQADTLDYLVAVASGVLCGMLDVLWVGEFNLERGREIASDKVESFVKKAAKLTGCESDDLGAAVKHLEKLFPIPSDGNTPDFGGGLQHHLRDFAHHPTIVGLMFSLLTQFTYKSYGTNTAGAFIIVDVPEKSRPFIGEDVTTKILYGTLTWFFHLVSDMAGSSSTAGKTGGTGIPGPLLALAKELSVLPFFRDLQVGEHGISLFLSKLFNGTLLAQHDENGQIIKDTVLKMDLRGELGIAVELGRQAIPVVANECIVRGFYFIRRLAMELKENHIRSLADIRKINWNNVKPAGNPTIARMLTVATGVFTTVDLGDAIISQKYWVSINYVGVGRFAVAIGEDVSWGLKARKVKDIKAMYENIRKNTFRREDQRIYERIESGMSSEKLGLTLEQTEILYNLEYLVTLNDIQTTKIPLGGESIRSLKHQWLDEWQQSMTAGFSSFVQIPDAVLHWYSEQELLAKIEVNNPTGTWFRLALLEAMLFEPYYPLTIETDKKGNAVPSKKYLPIHNPVCGFNKGNADKHLDSIFPEAYYTAGYIKRLRKCHGKVIRELNEVLKTALTSLAITAGITIAAIITAGAFAPAIAVALVGSNFAGLSGAALTSACLAYLGGGAIAIGGMGMAGGTIAIVGGGAILGLGVGAGVGGAVGAAGVLGKKNTILQSAKLMVSVREIFLNDEHDLAYSNTVYEQYVQNIMEIEKGLVELRLQLDVANGKDKKLLKAKIKEAEESVEAMKIARKSMLKFQSSFETGLAVK
ncbi:MAG: hypothetical protein J6A74_01640 [Oscillospiraceae bacterium]|nr:hypothetical protein [Oscillospiraceae bacterium]